MTTVRDRAALDLGWKFALGHAADVEKDFGYGKDGLFRKTGCSQGPGVPEFDDAAWRGIDLPHDWAVELPFDQRGDVAHGFKAVGWQCPENSVGWYRRAFDLPAGDEGSCLAIEFDGVFRNCVVWFNGHHMGGNFGGYNSFRIDVTAQANYGGRNVLAVRVDVSKDEGWFYEGAGIYRHVWLSKTAPLHVAPHGAFVRAKVGRGAAALTIQTSVCNRNERAAACRVTSIILDPAGKTVAKVQSPLRVAADATRELVQKAHVARPALWSLETPQRYTLVTQVREGSKLIDETRTAFGIRTVTFSAKTGFALNGVRMKLKGVCCHQDHAGVGSAVPDSLQEYRIRRLKDMGCNALRTSHNLPTAELLEACDRLGMLVMDETRRMGTDDDTLAELRTMVLRDRNRPCVVLWSIGNEEMAIQGSDVGLRIARRMYRIVKSLDPSRAVTQAMNGRWGEGFTHTLDVQGCNYIKCGNIDEFHKKFPRMPVLYSESASTLCTRGQYAIDEEKCYVTAYGREVPGWGSSPEEMWKHDVARPWCGGTFVWTGFDYRGEPTPYNRWPCINSHFGIMDTCGFPKDTFYYYKAWWGSEPLVHILPHWNWPGRQGQEIEVWVHTNCPEVDLLLDGQSLGRRSVEPQGHAEWRVPYRAGKLEARGYRDGKVIAKDVVETTGEPGAIVLMPDRKTMAADNRDAVVVNVAVTDSSGRIVPTADSEIQFSCTAGAKIIGVGNGNPSSHEADKTDTRRAFAGLCQVIVQSTGGNGPVTLTARSAGLKTAKVVIQSKA
ncbi:MAG: DUF4982 domain-containing protein [Planctomycetaceae bacterium]|nr:DUF4982 domain-containing protein [Planctomycetaceae bacterium]